MERVVTSYTWDVELPETWKTCKHKALPWAVAVEMGSKPEQIGSIYIPDNEKERSASDIGVVLFAGKDVPLAPGTPVLLYPGDGKIVKDFYECKNEVRLIGSYSRFIGTSERFPYSDSILAYWDGEWKATGNNVLIELPKPVEKSEGGILLADNATYREDRGRVVSVGESVNEDLSVGDTVCFAKKALVKVGKDGELYCIHKTGIYFVETN